MEEKNSKENVFIKEIPLTFIGNSSSSLKGYIEDEIDDLLMMYYSKKNYFFDYNRVCPSNSFVIRITEDIDSQELTELIQKSKISIQVSEPQPVIWKTLKHAVTMEKRYTNSIGEHWGHIILECIPEKLGQKIQFESLVSQQCIPDNCVEQVKKEVLFFTGTRCITDVKIKLIGGSYREGDSKAFDFKLAAIKIFRDLEKEQMFLAI